MSCAVRRAAGPRRSADRSTGDGDLSRVRHVVRHGDRPGDPARRRTDGPRHHPARGSPQRARCAGRGGSRPLRRPVRHPAWPADAREPAPANGRRPAAGLPHPRPDGSRPSPCRGTAAGQRSGPADTARGDGEDRPGASFGTERCAPRAPLRAAVREPRRAVREPSRRPMPSPSGGGPLRRPGGSGARPCGGPRTSRPGKGLRAEWRAARSAPVRVASPRELPCAARTFLASTLDGPRAGEHIGGTVRALSSSAGKSA